MSSQTEIFNAVLRQQIFLQRFAGGEAKQYAKAVDEARRATKRLLKGRELTLLSKSRRLTLEKDIIRVVNDIFKQANLRVVNNMEEFAVMQSQFHGKVLGRAVDTPIKAVTVKALNKTVFQTGIDVNAGAPIKLNTALSQFTGSMSRNIIRSLRSGIIAGDSNRDIRKALNLVAAGSQTLKANTLIRTITNHTSSQAKSALYKANSDVIEQEKYTAVLDGRTTTICAGLDGQLFPIGKGPHPPIHWNCRSVRTVVVKPEFNAASGVKTSRASRDPKTGKTVHTVDGRTNYNSWLKDQPKNFQEEVLGTARAKLFREGGLPISKFTDTNFKTLNLKQLKRMEPLAFEKSGL